MYTTFLLLPRRYPAFASRPAHHPSTTLQGPYDALTLPSAGEKEQPAPTKQTPTTTPNNTPNHNTTSKQNQTLNTIYTSTITPTPTNTKRSNIQLNTTNTSIAHNTQPTKTLITPHPQTSLHHPTILKLKHNCNATES